MKKIICLLVIIVFISCDYQYDNFKITGVDMRAITLNDSVSSKKRYFLIDFTTVLCHSRFTLLGGGIEPALKGIDERIESIEIYTHNGKNISPYFKGWGMSSEGTISDGVVDYAYLSSPNITELVNSINNNDRQSTGERIKFKRLFYTSSEDIPYKIVVRFKDKQIKSKVISEKEEYKVISEAYP